MDQLLGALFQDRRRHPTRREVVARLVLSCLSIAVAVLSVGVEHTFTHIMLLYGGAVSTVAVIVLGGIGAILFVDTFANEIWPRHQRLPLMTRVRQYLWLACGLLHNLFAFLVFTEQLSKSLGAFLVIFAMGCFLLAFVDAAQEKSDTQCAR